MNENLGIIRNIINLAIKEKGTQGVVADEAGCDGAALSKFISGDGALKMEVMERIIKMSGLRIMPEAHYQDILAAIRATNRLWMDDNK